ncbi:MAG: GtrA family protein, partial [Victivallaceae bacterium]
TIYDNANRGTHFRPTLDSIKIYRLIFRHALAQLFKFLCSGLFSALVDLGFFALFYYMLFQRLATGRLLAAVVLARLISLTVNYLTNKLLVFKEQSRKLFSAHSFGKYLLLCAVIMLSSYFLTKFIGRALNNQALLLVKAGVDAGLFVASFLLQKHLVFKH